ncbi:MAG: FAD-binding oxidoreductase [Myxococcota bacterium]
MLTPFRQELGDALGANAVSDEPGDLTTYGTDWTQVYTPAPSVVAFPRTSEEAAAVLAMCDRHGVAVVPSGGRTGLAGGAVAKDGELVLSLERLRDLGEVDTLGDTVRVGAGVVTESVHAHAEPHGLTWPIDFASKGSSQVGGNIATNAGGVRVIRYGLTRQWVLGLQVALPSGDVLELGGALHKDNTGVDLRQLFIGSEGIYGIITAATLKLTSLRRSTSVFLFSVDGLRGVIRLFQRARRAPFIIEAFEMFTAECMSRLERHRGLASPLDGADHYVLLEVEAPDDDLRDAWLAKLFEDGTVRDGTMGQDVAQAASLWALREGISESLSATGMPHKNDVALPVARLEDFTVALEALFADQYPGWEICLFGHIGDGNLHVNVMKPDNMPADAFLERTHAADRHIFELVRAHGGSISAEHGIGLLKKPWLHYTRSSGEIALMRRMKAMFDPKNTLNPGKVLP